MKREHLIIIVALILVALYMLNKDNKDTVQSVGPMGRIRYTTDCSIDPFAAGCGPQGHIRYRREGFQVDDPANSAGVMPNHIRVGQNSMYHNVLIKNHIRHDNRNAAFKGMMDGSGY
jgi:hypothetical protein